MNSKDKNLPKIIGKWTGYFVSYLFFSFVLYFVLKFMGKITDTTNIFLIFLITLSIVLTGSLINLLLN